MKRIYLAARFARAEEMKAYKAELETLGHEVTSRWFIGPEWNTRPPIECANIDLEDIDRADALVIFGGDRGGGGRYFEMGYALANNLAVVAIGPLETVFHHHELVYRFETWEQFLREGLDKI